MCVCVHVHTYVRVFVYVSMCVCACMYVRVHTHLCVCVWYSLATYLLPVVKAVNCNMYHLACFQLLTTPLLNLVLNNMKCISSYLCLSIYVCVFGSGYNLRDNICIQLIVKTMNCFDTQ